MCGVSGYVGKSILPKSIIQNTLKLMENRGPDNQGYTEAKFNSKKIFLLSSRLKIVDRAVRSNQPMKDEDLTIIFNGEIYNTQELIKIIHKHGLKLKTKSDTEIILKLYRIYGTECVKYFDGMWAFAIFDKMRNFLFLSRDRIGEKPLYFFKNNSGLYFASETKFIRSMLSNYKVLNDEKIVNFLKNGYKSVEQSNESFFKDIYKVEAGANYIVKDDLTIKKDFYWKPKIGNSSKPIKDFEKKIRENFKKKIKLICNTDLKIGLSLSGGLDSNYILGFITNVLKKKVNTYSIIDKNDLRYNEEKLINLSVKKNRVINHKMYLSSSFDNFLKLKKLTKYYDKPVSTINTFLQSLIYKKMKDDKIKICLSGNGADELFAGYYHHYILYFKSLKSIQEKKDFEKYWNLNIYPLIRNEEYRNLNKKNVKSYFTLLDEKYLKIKIVEKREKKFCKNPLRNKMLNELILQTIPLALTDDDLNSMYYSIENRAPFLNKDLVDMSFDIPTDYLMKDSFNKHLLRLSSKNLIIDKIRLNREKKGFNASFNSVFSFKDKKFKEWFFDKDHKNEIYNYINKEKFLKDFSKDSNKTFADMSTQVLFNICSTKIFLEGLNR